VALEICGDFYRDRLGELSKVCGLSIPDSHSFHFKVFLFRAAMPLHLCSAGPGTCRMRNDL